MSFLKIFVLVLFVTSLLFALLPSFTLSYNNGYTHYKPPPILSQSGSFWLSFIFESVFGQKFTFVTVHFYPMGYAQLPWSYPHVQGLLAKLGSPVLYYTQFVNDSSLYEADLYTNGSYTSNGGHMVHHNVGQVSKAPNERYLYYGGSGFPFIANGVYVSINRTGSPPSWIAAWSDWFNVSNFRIVYTDGQSVSIKLDIVVNVTISRAQNAWKIQPDIAISGAPFSVTSTLQGLKFTVHTGVLFSLYTFRYLFVPRVFQACFRF